MKDRRMQGAAFKLAAKAFSEGRTPVNPVTGENVDRVEPRIHDLVQEIIQAVTENGEHSVSLSVEVSDAVAEQLHIAGYDVSYPGGNSAEYETIHVEPHN